MSEAMGPLPELRDDRRTVLLRVALGLTMATLVVAFFASGAHREISPEYIRSRVLSIGMVGPVVFVLAFGLIQPVGPSGHIFAVGASLIWPKPIAFALAMLGALTSQAVSFAFYRYVARDWARPRVPKFFAPYQARLETAPFRTTLLLRLLTFTWHPASLFLGISNVRFGVMMVATAIGITPTLIFDIWLLGRLLELATGTRGS